jgi:integrase
MAQQNKCIQPIPSHVYDMLKKDDPDIIIMPMSEEQIEKGKKFLEQLHEKEAKYPILKRTDESLKLFGLLKDLNSAHRIFTQELDYLPITAAIQNWLVELHEDTQIRYASYMTDLIKRKAIPSNFASGQEFSVGGLRHIDHKSIIQYIEQMSDLSENAKIARIECYISFTNFLERITFGWFKRALPITSKKYSLYRSSIKTSFKALSLNELIKFSSILAKTNFRDYLVALTMFYGVVRISEVLSLTSDQVDFRKNIIRFPQKRNNIMHEKPVTYPDIFIKQLKEYISSTQTQRGRNNHIFITRKGKPLTRSRINYSFEYASNEAKIKQVSPDSIRATWLWLKQSKTSERELINIIKTVEANLEK